MSIKKTEASVWLFDLLTNAGGKSPTNFIQSQAEEQGIAWQTVKRAKVSLNVVSERAGLTWYWSLGGKEDILSVLIQIRDSINRLAPQTAIPPISAPQPDTEAEKLAQFEREYKARQAEDDSE